MRELGMPAPAGKPLGEHLDRNPPGRASLLAELRRDPEVVAMLVGTRVPPQSRFQDKAQYRLWTNTLMLLVRGKALSLSVYTNYDDPADIDWIRLTTLRWIDELQRLNDR
jgi:hypothetical protein